MEALSQKAIAHVASKSKGPATPGEISVTLNFHPDSVNNGKALIEQLLEDGHYRSQFETKTSNGSLSAHIGGRRWIWESQMFGQAYDNAAPNQRPKYGALNYNNLAVGGSPRFGSAHLRLNAETINRTSFTYPDSTFEPIDFGVKQSNDLIKKAQENVLKLGALDNYIEAHIHGRLSLLKDVEAIILDPSFQGTDIEKAANLMPIKVEWHGGFYLKPSSLDDCANFRGDEIAAFIKEISNGENLRPIDISPYRDGATDAQTAKKVWQCLARFGAPN